MLVKMSYSAVQAMPHVIRRRLNFVYDYSLFLLPPINVGLFNPVFEDWQTLS